MTKRKDVSVIHNIWNDAQQVDKKDMDVEQTRGVDTDAGMIVHHFGSGVLLDNAEQAVLFDSDNLTASQAAIEAAGNFDGQGLDAQAQPSDITLGNQLEVDVTGTAAIGRLSIKVCIIGVSFDDELIMDRFYFYANEKQITSNHYKTVLSVFFYDFKGNNNCSRDLGGRIVIREVSSFQLSRDDFSEVQDVEPDLWWRDFKRADQALSLGATIQAGIGSEFSVDALNINTTGTVDRTLKPNDVVSRVGQKFKAGTDNIQKVTLLLGVRLDGAQAEVDQYDWTGDLVINIYPLQTSTNCPTDIVPNLAIDFDPESEPLAQLSFSQTTLEALGYVLTDVLQPVDFVFNTTKLGSGDTSTLTVGNYYAVTLGRAGANTSGTIFMGTANDRLSDSRLTLFSGVWVDVTNEDLWFQIWTDAAKIADGRGYDEGNGIQYDKTTIDPSTGSTIDNQITNKPFSNTGEGILNIGILQARLEESVTIQDERTGNNINSRQEFVPTFSFIEQAGLDSLRLTTEPLIIGCAEDVNPKQNATLIKTQNVAGLATGDQFCVINPDADLLSLNLVGSSLVPNTDCLTKSFRIVEAEFCTDGYGDVNGDGYIDALDIARATTLLGESLLLDTTQQKIIDGYFTTFELRRADVDGDGYITSNDVDLITSFVNKTINSFPAGTSFTHMCFTVQQNTGRFDGYFDCDGYVRLDGYTGQNIVDPNDLSDAELKFDGYLVDPVIQADAVFTTVPFPGVTYQIIPRAFWQPYFVGFASDAREVPAAFCQQSALVSASCSTTNLFTCATRPVVDPTCDPGRNDFYVPDNLILGRGQIIRPNGIPAPIDFEIGTVILQLPADPLEEVSLNIFDQLVADQGNGFTRGGYKAMRYSDCTTVQDEDLLLNRVKFSVSVQAFVPNLDGYDAIDGYGIVIDDIIGVHLDPITSILKLTIKDLFVDQVFMTLVTKIQVEVYLKKSGWINPTLIVPPTAIAGLLA